MRNEKNRNKYKQSLNVTQMNGSDLHIDSFKLINQHGDSIDGKIYNKIDSEISSEARNGTDSVRADQIHAGINDNSPLVIIVHGFKGHAEWGFYPYVASKIAESGGIALTFNFSLNGRRLPDGKISEPEKFSQNTISREIEDLRQVIEGYATGKIMSDSKSCWNGKIYILGHSRGAAVGVLAAGRYATVNEENNHDATNDIKINKIAGWSTLGKFDRYSDRQKEIWRETGKFDFVDFRAQQKVSLDYSYWLDICENKYQTLL